MSGAVDLAARLEALSPVGRGPLGTTRLAWTPEDAAAGDWFRGQAGAAGLRVERDPAGNLWAAPDAPPPGGRSALTWTPSAGAAPTTAPWVWPPGSR